MKSKKKISLHKKEVNREKNKPYDNMILGNSAADYFSSLD